MEMILALLLYLQFILSPGTYQITQIEQLQETHSQLIENVQQSPDQMQVVNEVYLPQVPFIIIDQISGNR